MVKAYRWRRQLCSCSCSSLVGNRMPVHAHFSLEAFAKFVRLQRETQYLVGILLGNAIYGQF